MENSTDGIVRKMNSMFFSMDSGKGGHQNQSSPLQKTPLTAAAALRMYLPKNLLSEYEE
jgi:hypothetical protein